MDLEQIGLQYENSNMTMEKYLSNPTGIKNNTALNLPMIKQGLDYRYDKLIKVHKRFKFTVYKKDDNVLLLHMKLPSETYNIFYDVLIEMREVDTLIRHNTFKLFSNSPSFVFNYAYVYNAKGMIIPELASKYGDKVLKHPPNITNYLRITSYEKSVYYTILYILMNYEQNKELESKAKQYNEQELLELVSTPDVKIAEYQRKRKHEAQLRKRDLGAAMVHKMKLEAKKREKLAPKKSSEHIIKGKEKIKGKKKITGKKKK